MGAFWLDMKIKLYIIGPVRSDLSSWGLFYFLGSQMIVNKETSIVDFLARFYNSC